MPVAWQSSEIQERRDGCGHWMPLRHTILPDITLHPGNHWMRPNLSSTSGMESSARKNAKRVTCFKMPATFKKDLFEQLHDLRKAWQRVGRPEVMEREVFTRDAALRAALTT